MLSRESFVRLWVLFCSGSWRDQEFKAYNFNALGLPPTGGYLHPLLKVLSSIQSLFLQMRAA